ncbi:trypsin-like peptidase domain-containing protein [Pinibacter soli]|uniref:Trypsin-like peptidase domain-containing protein n=1 Tax=Pinibacter soli TaxID=3044211 RepID=A0ABT6RG67_9BACT|nr:trypsin-like peptidase domain-containing protein [Pinibacter soli]MDI3321550.1 trypsin-like peptidase domain-containing protein [Pinibacter soli]
MTTKQVFSIILISAATSVGSMWAYNKITTQTAYQYPVADSGKLPSNYAGFFDGATGGAPPTDFTQAASAAIPATVHIKTKATRTASNNLPRKNPLLDLFGFDFDDDGMGGMPRSIPSMASGSGAIISEDGYIVTNNHVIEDADEINVTLNNQKSFKAKLIGTDPSSDIAVIKIDAKGLPFLLYGNSDDARIGQWVLAVGYPLTLETTVTAGIISAKGRTLNINGRQSNTPIESFIQTDAAVNPGNSGGPLISTDGKMLGINSAIASPTGSFAGYSFTIPVNIVKKIVADIIKYGTAQRAYLGINYLRDDITEEQKSQAGIKNGDGVYVMDVVKEGAAASAGIKKGDFIEKINDVTVATSADMVGQIATYRPGDKIKISYRRDGKLNDVMVTLRNSAGTTEVVKNTAADKLGADLETLSKKDANELGVKGGVLVKSLKSGGLLERSRIQEGYVILKVNGQEVKTVDEFRKAIESSGANAKLEGVYPGYEGIYPYPLKLSDN